MAPRFLARTRRVAGAVLDAVDATVEDRWETALRRADETGGTSLDERVEAVIRSTRQELTAVGAAAGGTAAIPGVGTVASLGTAAGEMVWFTARMAEAIMTIAAIHGHTDADLEERKAWILSVLAFGDDATTEFDYAWRDVWKSLSGRTPGGKRVNVLRRVNESLAGRLLTRYATRRSAVALGRVLPFGIGAALGGGANYVAVERLGRSADKLFRSLPPGLADRSGS